MILPAATHAELYKQFPNSCDAPPGMVAAVLILEANRPEGRNVWYWQWQGLADSLIARGWMELLSSSNYNYTVRTTDAGRQAMRERTSL